VASDEERSPVFLQKLAGQMTFLIAAMTILLIFAWGYI